MNVYGVQAIWAPQNELLTRHDLGLRMTGQVARWVTTADESPYHSLIDGSVMAELRYLPWPGMAVRPFIGAGLGFHLLSNVHIEYRDLATASISARRRRSASLSAITDATRWPR